MPKKLYTEEFKLGIINKRLKGDGFKELSKIYGVHYSDIQKWCAAYEKHGISGIVVKNRFNKYD